MFWICADLQVIHNEDWSCSAMQHFARRQPPELLQSLILIVPHEGFLHLVLCKGKRGGSSSSIECFHYLQIYIVGKNINVGSTIVNPPLFFFLGGGGRFAIVNFRSQLSPQIKKANQNHSTTNKRIKKKNNASQNSCLLLYVFIRIYNCN